MCWSLSTSARILLWLIEPGPFFNSKKTERFGEDFREAEALPASGGAENPTNSSSAAVTYFSIMK